MRKLVLVLGIIVAIVVLVILSRPDQFSTRSERFAALDEGLSASDRGIAAFAFGDFGALSSDTLQTSAAPWKILVAALALREVAGDLDAVGQVDTAELFRRYGFHSPTELANWPDGLVLPPLDAPLGLNTGYARHGLWPIEVTIANTGCAACHSSVVYRADGTPDITRVWLGAPNGSINLEAYATDVFAALRDHGGDAERLMAAVDRLFPDTSWQERMTLRRIIRPILAAEISDRAAGLGRLLPFSGGLPGATNGLDALQFRLGLIGPEEMVAHSVFNSVPDLGGRVWRTGFLNTNTYAVPGQPRLAEMEDVTQAHLAGLGAMLAYFTVPSMGVTDAVAEAHIPDTVDIVTWMAGYQPQPFPGEIDRALLPRGRDIYAAECAACHGRYDADLNAPALVSFPNWLGEVGTDRARIELTGPHVADAVNAGRFGAYIAATAAAGYIAPPLTGLWSSAPYLHNGSVPTLWHLMHPEARPERFVVGGHALDMARVGIAGVDDGARGWMPPEDHAPWAIAVEIDTTAFGLGHEGHEAEFEALGAGDRAALLEYLKLL